jgi:hypothetical protein
MTGLPDGSVEPETAAAPETTPEPPATLMPPAPPLPALLEQPGAAPIPETAPVPETGPMPGAGEPEPPPGPVATSHGAAATGTEPTATAPTGTLALVAEHRRAMAAAHQDFLLAQTAAQRGFLRIQQRVMTMLLPRPGGAG